MTFCLSLIVRDATPKLYFNSTVGQSELNTLTKYTCRLNKKMHLSEKKYFQIHVKYLFNLRCKTDTLVRRLIVYIRLKHIYFSHFLTLVTEIYARQDPDKR